MSLTKNISSLCLTNLITLCAVFILNGCKNEDPISPPSTTNELKGNWSGHIADDTTRVSLSFTESEISSSITSMGTQTRSKGTYSTDQTANPKQINVILTEFPSVPEYVGKTALGIYKISHDTLIYAADEPGNSVRPTSFSQINSIMVFVLTRQ